MFHDMHHPLNMDGDYVLDNAMSGHANINEEPNKEAKKFYDLLKGVNKNYIRVVKNFPGYLLSFTFSI